MKKKISSIKLALHLFHLRNRRLGLTYTDSMSDPDAEQTCEPGLSGDDGNVLVDSASTLTYHRAT
jgi:hypothetical protein